MNLLKRILNSSYEILISDETLLRLLYYPPADLRSKQPNPLSETLPNIIVDQEENEQEIEDMWNIRDRHILRSSKDDDLEDNQLCRVYIYLGKTRSSIINKSIAKQEIVIDVFCHNLYGVDLRLESISSRLNELLVDKRIFGLGRVGYRNGYDFVAPKEYRAYRHIYEIGRPKL